MGHGDVGIVIQFFRKSLSKIYPLEVGVREVAFEKSLSGSWRSLRIETVMSSEQSDPSTGSATEVSATEVASESQTATGAEPAAASERKPLKIGSQRPGSPPIKAVSHLTPPVRIPRADSPSVDLPSVEAPAADQAAAAPAEIQSAKIATAEAEASEVQAFQPPEIAPVAPTATAPGEVAPAGSAPSAAATSSTPRARREFEPKQSVQKAPVPNLRAGLPPELEVEVALALGDLSMEAELEPLQPSTTKELENDSRQVAQVVSIHNDDVFVELGGRNQGVLSLRQFPTPPEVGQKIQVLVHRFDQEEGLYQMSLPGGFVDVGDWSQVSEGSVVEARITGHNKGGLECEVGKLRGFIPASQVAAYRVEDFAPFVGEKMVCVVTEANPDKRNLVLSRRAVLDREKAEAKDKLMAELAVGQVREGLVRSIQDYGAFIDLGGVDGLLHVSQLSWKRVKHPSEVLHVGQKIKVLIRKIDPESGKLSLAFRDLTENPWTMAAAKYPVTAIIRGSVTKVMDFGAFVELEPGIEGLVHISELAHGRVFRVRDIVKEGEEVEAKVLAIDPEQQRISLSIKAIQARPETIKKAEPEPEVELPPLPPSKRKGPLKGGMNRPSGGEQVGLKW
jgi:small subunit ribosomal protein S1